MGHQSREGSSAEWGIEGIAFLLRRHSGLVIMLYYAERERDREQEQDVSYRTWFSFFYTQRGIFEDLRLFSSLTFSYTSSIRILFKLR